MSVRRANYWPCAASESSVDIIKPVNFNHLTREPVFDGDTIHSTKNPR